MAITLKYHPNYGPSLGRPAYGYFVGGNGLAYDFGRIKQELKNMMGYPKGAHISVQLEFLGLTKEFETGSSPCELPYTFAE